MSHFLTKNWKMLGFFFNISCWGDEILKRKSLLKKTPMIKALTRNLHYVFKSLAFITQRGQRFFEVAFLCLRTSNMFIFWQFYAWGRSTRSTNYKLQTAILSYLTNYKWEKINLTIMCRNDELSWTMSWVGCLLTD